MNFEFGANYMLHMHLQEVLFITSASKSCSVISGVYLIVHGCSF
jgi:hypothetical protein